MIIKIIITLLMITCCVSPGVTYASVITPADEQFDFANGLYVREMYEMAIVEYEKFITSFSIDKRKEIAFYRIGECFRALEKYSNALNYYYKCIDIASPQMREKTLFRIGEMLFRMKKYNKAIKTLQKISNDKYITASALYYIARSYTQLDKKDDALLCFKNMIEQYPETDLVAYAYLNIGYFYLDNKDWEKAIKNFTKVKGEAKREALYRMAQIYYYQGKYKKAEKIYRELTNDKKAELFVTQSYIGLLYSLYNGGSFAKVIKESDRIIELVKKDNPLITGEIFYITANSYMKIKDYKKAVEFYSKLISQIPSSPYLESAKYKKSLAYFELGDLTNAVIEAKALLKTATAAKVKSQALFLLAKIEYRNNNFKSAIMFCEEIYTKYPETLLAAEALYLQGSSYYKLSNFKQSAVKLRLFADKFTDNALVPEALLLSAQSFINISDYDEAIKNYKRIIKNYTDTKYQETALFKQGLCYSKKEDFNSLIRVYNLLCQKYPDTEYKDKVLYWLGAAYNSIGDYEQAIVNLEKLLTQYEDFKFTGDAKMLLAFSYYKAKKLKKAADTFIEIINSEQRTKINKNIFLWLSNYLYENNRYDESIKVCKTAMAIYRNNSDIEIKCLSLISDNFIKQKKWDSAKENLFKIIDKFGNYAEYTVITEKALYSIGLCFAEENNYDKALEFYNKALVTEDAELSATINMEIGELFFNKKNYDSAAKAFMKTAILYNHPILTPKALFRAGNCFEKISKLKEAKNVYEEIITKYKESSFFDKAVKKLKNIQ